MPFTKGHKVNVGRKYSDERNKKVSEAMKGRKLSKAHRDVVVKNLVQGGWNKGMTGIQDNEKNGNWKGNDASYSAKHAWVRKYKGRPSKCEECGLKEERKYQWSNISGEYRRELSDYRSLCVPCHKKYDIGRGKFTATCPVCLTDFTASLKNKVYCGKTCWARQARKKLK